MLDLIKRAAIVLAAPIFLSVAGFYAGGAAPAKTWAGLGARAMLGGGALALAAAVVSIGYSFIGAFYAHRSREALVHLFAFGRRLVPITMALIALGVGVGAVGGICWLVTNFHIGGAGAVKLGFIGLGLLAGVFVGLRALLEAFRAFRHEPMPQMGREVTEREAPELWSLTRALAKHVGAPAPDAIIVGLLGGPFVTACEMRLEPEGRALAGRILYLPLPALLILDIAQLSAVLSHELAHFSGEDAEYSQRLAPSYAAMGRAMQTIASHSGGEQAGQLSAYLALSQLVVFVGLFDRAVQRWSRERELRADRVSGSVIGADFAAAALARYATFTPYIEGAIDAAIKSPAGKEDLVARIAEVLEAAGAQDPRPHLQETTAHPTDTHPPIAARVVALGQPLDDAFLAEAGKAAPPDFCELVDLLFNDARTLSAQLTADLLSRVEASRREVVAHLTEMTNVRVEARAYYEKQTVGGAVSVVFGWGIMAFGALVGAGVLISSADTYSRLIVGGLILFVGFMLVRGARVSAYRRKTPFVELSAGGLRFVDADLALSWGDIVSFRATAEPDLVIAFTLRDTAPIAGAASRDKRLKIDAKNHVLTLKVRNIADCEKLAFANRLIEAHRAAMAEEALREFGFAA